MTRTFRAGLLAASCLLGAVFTPQFVATAQAEIPAKAFGELPMIHDAAISPDGTRVALYINLKGTYGIRIVDLDNPSGKVVGALLPKDAKPEWIKWANDDRVLVSVWQSERLGSNPYRIGSIYTMDATDGKGKWLVGPERSRSIGSNMGSREDNFFEQFYNDVVDFLPNDPDHILMTFEVAYDGIRPVHKVNVETGDYSLVERANDNIQNWVTDMTGEVRVAKGLKDDAKTSDDVYMKIRLPGGEWVEAKDWPGLDATATPYGFTSNPNELVLGMRRGQNTTGLYVYDLGQKRVTRTLFTNEEYDVSGIVIDDGEVIGARYVGDTSNTEIFDGYDTVISGVRRKYPNFQIDYVDSNDGGDTVLYTLSSAYDPGVMMMQREGEESPRRIGDLRPSLNSDELGLVVPVKYTAQDGSKIPAYVTLPPTVNDTAGIKSLPFIVLPHGGPFARDAAEFDYFAQFFATRGYGVLQMNFRGSTGYGESFAKAGRENWAVMRSDVTDGAKWLLEKGYADPERMCVAGWSFGGYAALMNGVDHPELFNCVISIAGLSDMMGAIDDAQEFRFSDVVESQLRAGFRDKADMKANSPVRVVGSMTQPVFIAHGTFDQQVQYSQHRKLRNALKKSSAKVTELTFKDEDHYMSQQVNRQKLMVALEKFLVSVNGPSEFVKK